MKIHVTYTGQLKAITKTAAETIHLPEGENTVNSLLFQIAEHYGELAHMMLVGPNQKTHRALIRFVNNTQITPGANPKLGDGDSVTLIPPISGGVNPKGNSNQILTMECRYIA